MSAFVKADIVIDSIGDFFANPFNDLVGGGADMLVGDE